MYNGCFVVIFQHVEATLPGAGITYSDLVCVMVVLLLYFSMLKLLKPGAGITYSDLVVSFESMDQEDIPGPPVRYHFGL